MDLQLLPNSIYSPSHPRRKYLTDTYTAGRVSRQLPAPKPGATNFVYIVRVHSLALDMMLHNFNSRARGVYATWPKRLWYWPLIAKQSQKLTECMTRKWSLHFLFLFTCAKMFYPASHSATHTKGRSHSLFVMNINFKSCFTDGALLISFCKQCLLSRASNWITTSEWTFNEACRLFSH